MEKTVAVAHLDSAPLWRVLLDMQVWEISSLDFASVAIAAYVQGHSLLDDPRMGSGK